jgi:hypothetical protein
MGDYSKIRILTDSEARVAWSILSGGLGSEEKRIRDSGIPRSTYQDAKRRLYSEGVLVDRFVPNPSAIGIPRVSFLLLRPPAEEIGSVARTLAEIPGAVETWIGAQTAFSVIFHESIDESESLLKRASGGQLGNPLAIVSVDTGMRQVPSSQVPVYFDFEGVWVRYCGQPGARRYPCPLPPPCQEAAEGSDSPKRISPPISSLLTRHFTRPSHLTGPYSVPRSQKRSLQLGRVEWRVFLGLLHLPTIEYQGMSFEDLIFVTGKPREPDGLGRLLSDLAADCNVRPFLLVGDHNSVLIASLGVGVSALKVAPDYAQPRNSVIKTVARHVKEIEVINERLSSLRMPVEHRYDRLV